MDFVGWACEPRRPVWLRVLLVLLVLTATSWVARVAHAQAPPASFFEGRSNDELRALASDRHNDVLVRRGAATKLVMTLADAGDYDGADAAAREFAKNIDPFAVKHARAVRRRSYVHVVGVGALGLDIAVAIGSLVAARRSLAGALRAVRRVAPLVISFLLYAGLAGGWLASSYENSSSVPFVLFAACMLPLVVLFRMWSAVGSSSGAARAGRGVAAVTATVALGFLVVEQVNPSYLEGFGL
jgi:hypothetical protein